MKNALLSLSEDSDYYQWRINAQRNGLGYAAALATYVENSGRRLYLTFVDDKPVTAPVFTYQRWRKSGEPNEKFVAYDDEFIMGKDTYDEDLLRESENIIESFSDSPSYPAEVGTYTWNNPTYVATDIDKDTGELDSALGYYYPLKEKSIRLEEELYRELYQAGVSPDISYSSLSNRMNRFEFNYRGNNYSSFTEVVSMEDGPYLIGSSCIVLFNTGDNYVMPVATRSSEVSEAQEWKTPIPGGVFQPESSDSDSYPEPDNRKHVLREFAENFSEYTHKEHATEDGESYRNVDAIQRLEELLKDNEASLSYTSTGIDCLKHYVQIYSVLVIDDPEYYDEHIPDEPQTWEDDTLEFVDVSDGTNLRQLLNINKLNPYHIMGMSEGLQYAEENHGVEVGVDLS